MEHKVYIFANEAAAEAFKMTAYHFGYDKGIKRIGSALFIPEKAYQTVLDNTYATPAPVVATVESAPSDWREGAPDA